ncbi:MAG: DNA polymerase I [Hydrogenophilaceae bacterium]|nr:DNA polymerase I [Hydrogenophilaceae bacterium]
MNDTQKTLLLVDGSSYLYRAFHALPDLRNRHNQPTGAVYGVISMLKKLEKDYPADYIACVFDPKGKTFRDDWYPQYKANRPPMAEDLSVQIAPLFKGIRALGWPLVVVEGVEADDVIGTLVAEAARKGVRSIVSTGDKDMAQLVNDHVILVNTMSNETLDESGVSTKFGVPPDRIVDYLALIGDSVDNVPGVEKVGPKTAVKWLNEYGTLDSIIERASEIKGVVGENLRKALDWLPMGRKLVTIKKDVPLPLDLESLKKGLPDREALLAFYENQDFRTWLRELRDTSSSENPVSSARQETKVNADDMGDPLTPAAPSTDHRAAYECILDDSQLNAWMEKISQSDRVAFDTETTSLDPMTTELVGMSFSMAAGEAAYLPLAHRYPGVPDQLDREATLKRLKSWLESEHPQKIGQNLKFDRHVLANHGIRLNGIAHDTLLESYVAESHMPHDLDSLAARYTGLHTLSYQDVTGKGAKQIGFDQVSIETATKYAAEDADVTLRVHEVLYPQIEAVPGLKAVYQNIELPVSEILFRMERNGVLLDREKLAAQSRQLGESMLTLEEQAYQLAGRPFNLNSPKQIQEIFFGEMKLPVIKKTPSGQPSTDEEVLETLAADYPLPKKLLEYRGLAKLKSTYTDKLPQMINPKTGRVHTSYSQATAVTGRLASSDPNLQNIPVRTQEGRRIREAFIAPPGSKIISADYSQIELRIMAHLSGDEGFLRAFAEDRDIHTATAAEVFGLPLDEVGSDQRRMAKVINFGLIYGMSSFGLASQLGLERSAAQAYIDRYFARYPGVANYMQRTREQARSQGFVETVFGRRLYLPEINSKNPARRQGAERAAINAPMQGTAADLIKLSMIAVQGWLDTEKLASRMIMQVHDELVLEVPDGEVESVKSKLPMLMAGVAELKVMLKAEVGVGPNWEAAH